jgi:hypothetical protein
MRVELDSWDIEKAIQEYVEKHFNLKVDLKDQYHPPCFETQVYKQKKDKNGKNVPDLSKPIFMKRKYIEMDEGSSWISFNVN